MKFPSDPFAEKNRPHSISEALNDPTGEKAGRLLKEKLDARADTTPAPFSILLKPNIRAALKKAADHEDRTLSNIALRYIKKCLKEDGFLKGDTI